MPGLWDANVPSLNVNESSTASTRMSIAPATPPKSVFTRSCSRSGPAPCSVCAPYVTLIRSDGAGRVSSPIAVSMFPMVKMSASALLGRTVPVPTPPTSFRMKRVMKPLQQEARLPRLVLPLRLGERLEVADLTLVRLHILALARRVAGLRLRRLGRAALLDAARQLRLPLHLERLPRVDELEQVAHVRRRAVDRGLELDLRVEPPQLLAREVGQDLEPADCDAVLLVVDLEQPDALVLAIDERGDPLRDVREAVLGNRDQRLQVDLDRVR